MIRKSASSRISLCERGRKVVLCLGVKGVKIKTDWCQRDPFYRNLRLACKKSNLKLFDKWLLTFDWLPFECMGKWA